MKELFDFLTSLMEMRNSIRLEAEVSRCIFENMLNLKRCEQEVSGLSGNLHSLPYILPKSCGWARPVFMSTCYGLPCKYAV